MTPLWWSILLAVVGVAGLWIAGSGRAAGWAIGLGAQVLWIVYAVASRQWGFILSALAYGVVYGRNLARWRAGDWYARGAHAWMKQQATLRRLVERRRAR